MGDLSAEPSMEDILSSIKRIIAEDGDAPAPRPRRSTARAAPTTPPEAADTEILELSDPMPPAPKTFPPHRPADTPATKADTASAAPTPPDPDMPEILSESTAQAARGSLDSLSRLLVKPEAGGDGTLEGLVREMLRPMLRDWLDANLPEIVEAMVAKEISKITGQVR